MASAPTKQDFDLEAQQSPGVSSISLLHFHGLEDLMADEEEVGGGDSTSETSIRPSRPQVHTDASQAPVSTYQDDDSEAQSVLSQDEGTTSVTPLTVVLGFLTIQYFHGSVRSGESEIHISIHQSQNDGDSEHVSTRMGRDEVQADEQTSVIDTRTSGVYVTAVGNDSII
jgi:hypothetical protein